MTVVLRRGYQRTNREKTTVNPQGEDRHLQTKTRGLGRKPTLPTP